VPVNLAAPQLADRWKAESRGRVSRQGLRVERGGPEVLEEARVVAATQRVPQLLGRAKLRGAWVGAPPLSEELRGDPGGRGEHSFTAWIISPTTRGKSTPLS
jgi:hypothetical protein